MTERERDADAARRGPDVGESGRESDVDEAGQGSGVDEAGREPGGASGRTGGTERPGRSGQRFVLALYVALVGVAAVAGLLTGTFVENLRPPRFLFVVPFPATPLGFAAYGGLTVALVLGVPLLLVRYVSRGIDE